MTSPSAARALRRSRSQSADTSAPNSGAVALITARYDAGRWSALNAYSANGSPEAVNPTTR